MRPYRLRLHEPTFGEDEEQAALGVLRSKQVTAGVQVRALEQAFGFEHGIACNSGSSANLLAFSAIVNPARSVHLQPGDQVIVPALAWSTTVWPIIQCGLVPVIVDIDPLTLNIDPAEIERAIGPRTRAICCVHVYGNPCDMAALTAIALRHDLILIEDCCEALGAQYNGSPVGSFGDFATFSFYFSHHVTTIEGGIVVARTVEDAELLRVLRAHGWTRDMLNPPVHEGIDPRFTFINVGYNMRLNELQAAIGLVQLPKLAHFVNQRRATCAWWAARMPAYELRVQQEQANGRSSFFGFAVTVNPNRNVAEFRAHLEAAGIETRPIICGNIEQQPAMRLYQHRIVGNLQHASNVMKNGLAWGCHQAVGQAEREHVLEVVNQWAKTS